MAASECPARSRTSTGTCDFFSLLSAANELLPCHDCYRSANTPARSLKLTDEAAQRYRFVSSTLRARHTRLAAHVLVSAARQGLPLAVAEAEFTMHAFIGPSLLSSSVIQPKGKPFEIHDRRPTAGRVACPGHGCQPGERVAHHQRPAQAGARRFRAQSAPSTRAARRSHRERKASLRRSDALAGALDQQALRGACG